MPDRARARGHTDEKIREVWELVAGFNGYAFCKAHSTAYGVEAYQAAWLKRYYPAEFMAGVLTNGKGFYHPLVYVLECYRLGLKLLPPSVNEPGAAFLPHGKTIRVPLTHVKGLTTRSADAILAARERGSFGSMANFFHRVAPNGEELEAMIRVGAFDEFGEARTRQFWQAQHLLKTYGASVQSKQGWLVPPPGLEQLPTIPLNEPSRRERLQSETDLFGFAVSGHPLELFDDVAWNTYCPVNRLGEFVGETVTTCGLVVEQRTHHQVSSGPPPLRLERNPSLAGFPSPIGWEKVSAGRMRAWERVWERVAVGRVRVVGRKQSPAERAVGEVSISAGRLDGHC